MPESPADFSPACKLSLAVGFTNGTLPLGTPARTITPWSCRDPKPSALCSSEQPGDALQPLQPPRALPQLPTAGARDTRSFGDMEGTPSPIWSHAVGYPPAVPKARGRHGAKGARSKVPRGRARREGAGRARCWRGRGYLQAASHGAHLPGGAAFPLGGHLFLLAASEKKGTGCEDAPKVPSAPKTTHVLLHAATPYPEDGNPVASWKGGGRHGGTWSHPEQPCPVSLRPHALLVLPPSPRTPL